MHQDALGLTLTTQSADAARAFDHAVEGYLTYRADASHASARCCRPIRNAAWRMC